MGDFSFKDFEKVKLTATYPITVGTKTFQPGETLAFFDSIQIAGLTEMVRTYAAKGGYNNSERIVWYNTENISLTFTQGVFSLSQFTILNNANLIEKQANTQLISMREILESDEEGHIELSHTANSNIFVYRKDTGNSVEFTGSGDVLTIAVPFLEVIVDYKFIYEDSCQIINLGQRLLNGFLELEGWTRCKDDITGNIVTGIIKIPKLKLIPSLSIKLGQSAAPVIGKFVGSALPVGVKGNTYVSEFIILKDDLTSDF